MNKKLILMLFLLAVFAGWYMTPYSYATPTYISGGTNQQITFVMFDSNGDPNSSLDTTLNVSYWEEGEAAAVGPVNMTQATLGTHADNKAVEIFTDSGMYVAYMPDAAFDGGVGKKVQFFITSDTSGIRSSHLEIQLDSTRVLSSELLTTGDLPKGRYNY